MCEMAGPEPEMGLARHRLEVRVPRSAVSRWRRRAVLGLLPWLPLLPEPGSGQEPAEGDPSATDAGAVETRETAPSNPFAGFETHFLSNGVKVWFKHLPGAPSVSVSAGVPVGSDADPPGKEQLAHFTEHMLFSDHDGRTEQEIKDAVEGIGGRRNGFTYRDRTWYYVTIGREHGLFAIQWLAGILSPHEMDPAVVDRGRQPVENEIRARPREFFDHLVAALNPGWLAPPDFWEREFGIERRRAPFPDMWRSLQGITPGGSARLLRPVLFARGHDRHDHRGSRPERGA